MAEYTEQTVLGSLEVIREFVGVQLLNQVLQDGEVIKSTPHRYVLTEKSDLKNERPEVVAFCKSHYREMNAKEEEEKDIVEVEVAVASKDKTDE